MLKCFAISTLVLALLALPGCGETTTFGINDRAKKAKTSKDLEDALGKPDKFEKVTVLGKSMENWTYKAKDGDVTYVILDGKIVSSATVEKEKK